MSINNTEGGVEQKDVWTAPECLEIDVEGATEVPDPDLNGPTLS